MLHLWHIGKTLNKNTFIARQLSNRGGDLSCELDDQGVLIGESLNICRLYFGIALLKLFSLSLSIVFNK